ncbi:hypothetical protein STEG23_028159, partial [Scotinomys teguina]
RQPGKYSFYSNSMNFTANKGVNGNTSLSTYGNKYQARNTLQQLRTLASLLEDLALIQIVNIGHLICSSNMKDLMPSLDLCGWSSPVVSPLTRAIKERHQNYTEKLCLKKKERKIHRSVELSQFIKHPSWGSNGE